MIEQDTIQPTEETQRKRGAQPGNSNRLVHGYYSKFFKKTEREALLTLREGLDDEVEMLRVAIRRVFKLLHIPRTSDLSPWHKNMMMTQTLSTLGIATTRLAHLCRTKKFLEGGSGSEFEELMNSALDFLDNDNAI